MADDTFRNNGALVFCGQTKEISPIKATIVNGSLGSGKLKRLMWLLTLVLLFAVELYCYQSVNPLMLFASAIFVFSLRFIKSTFRVWHLLSVALILSSIYLLVQVQSLFILVYIFLGMTMLQLCFGRTNVLPYFVAVVALPVSATFLHLISFDLRLISTAFVSRMLHSVVNDVYHEGNIIFYHQQAFGVDDVCSGIVMMQTGLLCGLMLIAWFERKHERTAGVFQILFCIAMAALLIFLSNIFRICITVLFRLPEDGVLHQVSGLVSMLIYYILPFYFFLKKYAFRFRKTTPAQIIAANANVLLRMLLLVWAGGLVLFALYARSQKLDIVAAGNLSKPGYTMKKYPFGVVQYSRPGSLIYVKPGVPFYAADHHPRICWKGSGYQFTHEKVIRIKGYEIVTAQLINDAGEIMYSAYWFQYQQHVTANEFVWRRETLIHGHSYNMINITTSTDAELMNTVRDWLPASAANTNQ